VLVVGSIQTAVAVVLVDCVDLQLKQFLAIKQSQLVLAEMVAVAQVAITQQQQVELLILVAVVAVVEIHLVVKVLMVAQVVQELLS
jgi:hypothetical protein